MRNGSFAKVFLCVLAGAILHCQTSSHPSAEKTSTETWRFNAMKASLVEVPPLGSAFAADVAATSALDDLWRKAQTFNSVENRQFVRFPAWKSPDYLEGLADVIAGYPGSTAALTAQLELAYAYMDVPGTSTYGRRLLDDVEISSGTWQGVMAKTKRITRSLLKEGLTAESERQVEELLPVLERLEQQLPSGLVEWKEHLYARPRYEFRAGLLNVMMEDCLQRDDRTGATTYAQRILAEFPEVPEARFARDTLKLLAEDYNPARPPPMKW
jgi:hypothetical protein